MEGTVEAGKEDDDESSSLTEGTTIKSALDEFREKWQQELKSDTSPDVKEGKIQSSENENPVFSKDDTIEQTAKLLFIEGTKLERSGKVFEAMRLYRKAVQLVPDIEFKIYETNKTAMKQKMFEKEEEKENLINKSSNLPKSIEDDEDLEDVDLIIRFQNILAKSKKLFGSALGGDKQMIVTSAHFSDLPMEVILYILRWVVSSDLDLKSLERFSQVCRGFFLLARDQEIWRHACLNVWGVNLGLLKASPFTSWREMYIQRSRVQFHGCYICRTSYFRYGENSFQDQFYRPVQLVEYYRYFRFFPDGKMLMLTSSEEPQNSVGKLKTRNPSQIDILRGHYRLLDDVIIIVMKRNRPNNQYQTRNQRKNAAVDEVATQTFYLELKIVSTSKRSFSQLHWKQYSLVQMKNKHEKKTNFDLAPNKYPPFYFSRVKSYHVNADSPLK